MNEKEVMEMAMQAYRAVVACEHSWDPRVPQQRQEEAKKEYQGILREGRAKYGEALFTWAVEKIVADVWPDELYEHYKALLRRIGQQK